MPKNPPDKEALRREYNEVRLKYERLARNLHRDLKSFLDDAKIDVVDVVYRIKDFGSFWDKIQRKDYKDPLREIEDICGIRIICFYSSDLEKISRIINTEFNVEETIDTADLLKPAEFGYRSLHFITTVKGDWLKAPSYRGLGGLKAEVQVRTILMHAWAGIGHKLAYKKEEHVPDQFKRKLYQLSALFEIADEQFDTLRKEKEEYRENLVSKDYFDASQPMNLDSLQAFLDFYFPDRKKILPGTRDLLDEIMKYKVSIKELVETYERVKEILPSMELELFTKRERKEGGRWVQVGIVRMILWLTNDYYWKDQLKRVPKYMVKSVEKWRAKLSGQNR